jgi:hypothetical protein
VIVDQRLGDMGDLRGPTVQAMGGYGEGFVAFGGEDGMFLRRFPRRLEAIQHHDGFPMGIDGEARLDATHSPVVGGGLLDAGRTLSGEPHGARIGEELGAVLGAFLVDAIQGNGHALGIGFDLLLDLRDEVAV